jgi:transcriptional regulator with XRE-family HTH domain
MNTTGERIKARREELQMTVAALAKAAGIAPTTLYDLERGDQKSTTKLHRIAAVLGLSTDWVETGRGARLLETPRVSDARAHYSVHGFMMTPEAARVAAEWEKLDEPMRSQVALIIESLVATQIRSKRKRPALHTAAT